MLQKHKWAWALTLVTLISGAVTINIVGADAQVPVHWDTAGQIDRTDNALNALLMIPGIQILVVALFSALKFIEPRQTNLEKSGKALQAIVFAIVAFMVLVQALLIAQALGYQLARTNLIFGGIGLLFMIMGNYFSKLRSSFFIGIRTPWTLSSETVWKTTHRFGGKLFIIAGVILFFASLIQNETQLATTMIFCAVPAVLFPAAYSWILWRQEQTEKNNR